MFNCKPPPNCNKKDNKQVNILFSGKLPNDLEHLSGLLNRRLDNITTKNCAQQSSSTPVLPWKQWTHSIMLHSVLWQNLRESWRGCHTRLCRLCAPNSRPCHSHRKLQGCSVCSLHICAQQLKECHWARNTLCFSSTLWGWGRLKRRWLWSREVFHDSRFSSQAKPFLLTLD